MRILLAIVPLVVILGAASTPAKSNDDAAFSREDPALVRLLGDLVMAVDGSSIYGCVDAYTKQVPEQYRLMGTPTHEAFVEKNANIFQERAGLTTQVVHFDEGGASLGMGLVPLRQGGDNILGVLPGKDLTKWVVVGGHYDTRELTLGGGAYDNTSGMCTVLTIASAYHRLNMQPEATLVFAWWDGEEWGLYGSRAFLKDHNATKRLIGLTDNDHVDIITAVSFDMVGLNYPAGNNWIQYGDPTNPFETAILNVRTSPTNPDNFTLCRSYACYKYDQYNDDQLENFANYQELVKEVAYKFLAFPPQYVWVYDDQYGRSDHMPFIAAGVPGMRVQGSHDEEYPHYHQPTDTLLALQALAGDDTHLRAGFDKAADVGAVTLAYVAMKGNVGDYATGASNPAEGKPEETGAGSPGFSAALLVAALAVIGIIAARRRDAF